MARVTVNFLGPLRLFLGEHSVIIEVDTVAEARKYIEDQYAQAFQKKLRSLGVKKEVNLWDNSLFLLNGRSLHQEDDPVLKDQDRIDLGLAVAGG
jgi:molybdopterin converting factor small subunit